jgi:nitroreductase
MELLDLIKTRRSIRKYTEVQVPKEDLQKILAAGLYAPNAGGGQRGRIIAVQNRDVLEKLGRINASCMDRSRLAGNYVSADQPSIIDDPSIKSGFYGAPTVCCLFGPENFLYSIPDAFCCAENMALEAQSLGISSCIVARGRETFESSYGSALMKEWGISSGYMGCCFVLLGYAAGPYPKAKERKENRAEIIC